MNIQTISQLPQERVDSALSELCNWERIAYGEGLHRSPDQLRQWLDVENRGFYCVHDVNTGELLAYTDIWSVKQAFFQRLKVGLELEERIPAAALCTLDNPSRCWYVGSIIVNPATRDSNPIMAHHAFRVVCRALFDFFANQDILPLELIAVASSETGARILNRWKFSPVEMHPQAIDRRPRYVRRVTGK